ncbi:2576_t:CDS:2 [Entrophospora sp. SA101]|nr:2576_t:CDS:2 [Entrophospora sp. SA101]
MSLPIQSIQPSQPPPYLPHLYSYPPPLPPPPHIAPIQQQLPLPQHQSSSSLTHNTKRIFKKKEMYEYKAPWTVYGLDWSNKPGEKAFQLALGSLIEGYPNKLQIITLAELAHDDSYYHRQYSNSDFVKIAETDYHYPITKVLWEPYKGGLNDLLATTGDYLRIWEIVEDMDGGGESNTIGSNRYSGFKQRLVERESLINERESFGAPLTSFDWNEIDPTLIVTSSIDTTCAVWNIETKQLKTHLIAHDEEVYDVAFVTNSVDAFVSVGADESVRLFDLRSLKRSTIIYEIPRQPNNNIYSNHNQQQPQSPFLHLCFNKIEANYLATFHMNSPKVIILDIRNPGTPVTELDGHLGTVNCVNWSPNSSNSLCSGGDDCQVLIWDIKNLSSTSVPNPIITKYHKDATEMSQLNWSTRCPEWLAMAFGNTVKTLRVYELKFVKTEVSQEQLSNTFDEIANAIINDDNGDNLVDDPDDSDKFLDISEENTSRLYIENFIDLNHELLTNNVDSDLTDEFVEHGDVNFDIDEILNRVES